MFKTKETYKIKEMISFPATIMPEIICKLIHFNEYRNSKKIIPIELPKGIKTTTIEPIFIVFDQDIKIKSKWNILNIIKQKFGNKIFTHAEKDMIYYNQQIQTLSRGRNKLSVYKYILRIIRNTYINNIILVSKDEELILKVYKIFLNNSKVLYIYSENEEKIKKFLPDRDKREQIIQNLKNDENIKKNTIRNSLNLLLSIEVLNQTDNFKSAKLNKSLRKKLSSNQLYIDLTNKMEQINIIDISEKKTLEQIRFILKRFKKLAISKAFLATDGLPLDYLIVSLQYRIRNFTNNMENFNKDKFIHFISDTIKECNLIIYRENNGQIFLRDI